MEYIEFKKKLMQIFKKYIMNHTPAEEEPQPEESKNEGEDSWVICDKSDSKYIQTAKSLNQQRREEVDESVERIRKYIEKCIEEHKEQIKTFNPFLEKKYIEVCEMAIKHLELEYKFVNSISHLDCDGDFTFIYEHGNMDKIHLYSNNVSEIEYECRNKIYQFRAEEKKLKESQRRLELANVAKNHKMK